MISPITLKKEHTNILNSSLENCYCKPERSKITQPKKKLLLIYPHAFGILQVETKIQEKCGGSSPEAYNRDLQQKY